MKNDDDIQLMLRFKDGDVSAFEKIFNKYKKEVINTVYHIIGKKDEAEDLSQEVFLRIYNAGKRYQPTAEFKTYLHKITVNVCLSYLRRKKILQFIHLESLKDKEADDISNPEDIYDKKELSSFVRKAILQLPENQRTAIVLKHYNNLSYEEISKTLKTSVPSAKSLLFRARENLKKILGNYTI